MADYPKMNPPATTRYPEPPPSYFEVPPPHSQPPYPTDGAQPPYPGTPYPTGQPYPMGASFPPDHPYHPQPIGTPYPPQPITTGPVHSITVVAPQRPLGPKSEFVTCSQCNVQVWTRVETKPNMMTHTFALLLCCFILWPIAWIPYCCDACQSTLHYCSNCNAFVGEGTQI